MEWAFFTHPVEIFVFSDMLLRRYRMHLYGSGVNLTAALHFEKNTYKFPIVMALLRMKRVKNRFKNMHYPGTLNGIMILRGGRL